MYISVRWYVYFGGFRATQGDFGLGAVKRQKLFPLVPLTTHIERNDAQTRRPASRRGFNAEMKGGAQFISKKILFEFLTGV
jgi:hypothetical protein